MEIIEVRNGQKFVSFKNIDHIRQIEFNRPACARKDLEFSINEYGVISPIILIKTRLLRDGLLRYYNADGQHRAATAKYMEKDIPVFVIEYEFKSKAEIVRCIAKLNSSQKPWNAEDYVRAYGTLGYEDYNILLRIKDETRFSISTIAECLSLGTSIHGSMRKYLASGDFKAINVEKCNKTLSAAAYLSKHKMFTSHMLLALHKIIEDINFDLKEFEQKLIKNLNSLKDYSLEGYAELFESWIK